MNEKSQEQGWDRAQLTLRLPSARLARLRALANKMGGHATPTDAVVHAIDIAAAQLDASALDARLDSIEDELAAMSAERQRDTDRLEAAILAIGSSLGELHSLISELASQEPDEF
jgi:multidrug resistance efflux pump